MTNKLDKAIQANFGGVDEIRMIPVDMVIVKAQGRTEFENDEQKLSDLAANIKAVGLIEPLLVRPIGDDFELVCGERRLRALKLNGTELIPCVVKEYDDAQAKLAQASENMHRKNLTLFEELYYIKEDFDSLGNLEAVAEKYSKSISYISKVLGMYKTEQGKRLVVEGISSDIEAVGMVAQIEKVSPEKAKALVDDLKKNKGQNVREKAKAIKDEVKPSKKAKPEYKQTDIEGDKPNTPPATPKWLEEQRKKDAERPAASNSENAATARDRSFEEPSEVEVFAGAKPQEHVEIGDRPLDAVLSAVYDRSVKGDAALKILEDMAAHKDALNEFLFTNYTAGKNVLDISRAVLKGFRVEKFSTTGAGALALSAFLYGSDIDATFSMVDIIGSVKNV